MHGPPPSADDIAYRNLRASLTNHTPTEGQVHKIEAVRTEALALGTLIINNCPPSRERSLALTHLEDAVMWAVKGIVLPRESPSST